MCYIDTSKAFDSLNVLLLFGNLRNLHICPFFLVYLVNCFSLKFINIIQYDYTQYRYNNCDHEAKLIIRNSIVSIKKNGKR